MACGLLVLEIFLECGGTHRPYTYQCYHGIII